MKQSQQTLGSSQSEDKSSIIIGVDPGSSISGFVALRDGRIDRGKNADNAELFDLIKEYKKVGVRVRVIIEDIRPYSVVLSPYTIQTCKLLGELEYRLKTARIAFKLVPRTTIREWVFTTYPTQCLPLVIARMQKKKEKGKLSVVNKNGSLRRPSFHYVEDSVITAVMKKVWNIGDPVPGQKNQYGISEHAWQALALATFEQKKAPYRTAFKNPYDALGNMKTTH